MSSHVRYSDAVFDEIRDKQDGFLSVGYYYRKSCIYITLNAINLIFVTNRKGVVTSIVYENDDKIVTQHLINDKFTITREIRISAEKIYELLFSKLIEKGVSFEPYRNDNEFGYNITHEEVFGPAYLNLDGYLICLCNDNYLYNDAKPFGTYVGHILTNQPFSYQKFLSAYFTKDDEV